MSRPRLPCSRLAALGLAVLALGLAPAGQTYGLASPEAATGELSARHREFLDQAALLLGEDERRVFLELHRDYQRDAFIRAFWQHRDPYPKTPQNELLLSLEPGIEAARVRFGGFDNERARFMVLNGPPTRTVPAQCEILPTLEIWYYSQSYLVRGEYFLVFVRAGSDYRLWSPRESLSALLQFESALSDQEAAEKIAERCSQSDDILQALALAVDWEALRQQAPLLRSSGAEWALDLLSASTDLPEGAALLAAEVAIDYPGRRQNRTVVQALVSVDLASLYPADATSPSPAERQGPLHFLIDGEVLLRDELFESFRYRFDLAARPELKRAPLVLERYLRPGTYQLVLKVREQESSRYYRAALDLEVPNVARLPLSGSEGAVGAAAAPLVALGEANASLDTGLDTKLDTGLDTMQAALEPSPAPEGGTVPTLVLKAPQDYLITGRVRIEAQVGGLEVERVAFSLNGTELLTKTRPPYSVEIDLGRAPRLHRVRAEARDQAGHVLARDEILLNSGPHRFAVRLVEPQWGRGYRRSVRAVAEVDVPELERLERVEFFRDDTLVATLYQPPFAQPILIPEQNALSYVRVVAYLDSGAAVEDVVFVNAPDLVDRVDVDVVELYTSALDRRGRPVTDLEQADFQVREDGQEQTIRRFERVRDLPIHAGILLDTSTSMEDQLDEAEEAALHFFQQVLTQRDRACLITFNDEPALVVPFTNDVEVLAGGLAGMVSEGETALFDSVIYALYYFSGIRGKRALILLSDGEDVGSTHTYEEVLEFAQRAGVALYGVGLGVPQRQMDVRARLLRLSQETGGRAFFIETADELERIYASIQEELRSQYLLAYQSTATGTDFRQVEVEVARRGVETNTLKGYYP